MTQFLIVGDMMEFFGFGLDDGLGCGVFFWQTAGGGGTTLPEVEEHYTFDDAGGFTHDDSGGFTHEDL